MYNTIKPKREVIMKSIVSLALLLCLLSCSVMASYTYEVTEGYVEIPRLNSSESLLITGGGTGSFDMRDSSLAFIQGTSSLEQGVGGIWSITQLGESYLEFSGGELNELIIASDATCVLSGGKIDNISSTQIAWEYDDSDPPALVPNPHITIIYSGDLPTVDMSNIMTGLWGDASAFSIQLHDVSGYSPVIENIQFIPEPATLTLLGLGGLLIRRKYH